MGAQQAFLQLLRSPLKLDPCFMFIQQLFQESIPDSLQRFTTKVWRKKKNMRKIGNVFPPKYPCILHTIHPSIHSSINFIYLRWNLSACQTVGQFLLSSKRQGLFKCSPTVLWTFRIYEYPMKLNCLGTLRHVSLRRQQAGCEIL